MDWHVRQHGLQAQLRQVERLLADLEVRLAQAEHCAASLRPGGDGAEILEQTLTGLYRLQQNLLDLRDLLRVAIDQASGATARRHAA